MKFNELDVDGKRVFSFAVGKRRPLRLFERRFLAAVRMKDVDREIG